MGCLLLPEPALNPPRDKLALLPTTFYNHERIMLVVSTFYCIRLRAFFSHCPCGCVNRTPVPKELQLQLSLRKYESNSIVLQSCQNNLLN